MIKISVENRVPRRVALLMAGVASVTALPALAQSDQAPQSQLESPNDAAEPQASTASEGGDRGLGDIIVTATRRSENLQDVPLSVSAVGTEQLTSRGVTSSNDIGSVVPNLQVSSQYGETSPNFSLRGVGVTNEFAANTASPIGVYVNEVSQTFRYTHGLQLYDLDRVEVLRGPQGTLFGRNTTGGAVSIFTRQPELSDPNGYLTAGYGNFDRWKLQGAAEVTLAQDKAGIRIAFNRQKGDGYFKEPNPTFAGQDDYGTSDSIGVRGSLRLKPSEDLDIKIGGYYAKDDPIGYPLHYIGLVGADASGNGGTDFFGSTRAGLKYNEVALNNQGKFLTRSWGVSLNIAYNINENWSVTSVTGYTDSRYRLNIDNDATPQDVYFIDYDSKGKDFSQDFRVAYDSDNFKGLIGVYYGKDSINSNNVVLAYNVLPDAPPGTPPCSAANPPPNCWLPGIANSFNVAFGYKQKRDTLAFYSENTINITERLELTGGLRYTKDNVDFLDSFSTPITDVPGVPLFDIYRDFDIKNSYNNWSGRVILNYAWTDDIKTYVSASRGFRSATYNGFGFISADAVYFVPPERLDSLEFGFKTRFADDRLQLNGAFFFYDYKKQQVQEVIGGVAFLRSLDATVKGAELELLARPIQALTLRGSVGYLDTKYKGNQLLSGVDVGGNPIPFSSKWTLNIGGDLTVAEIGSGKIIASGEVTYRSNFWYDAFANNTRPAALVNDGMGGVVQLYPGGRTNLVGSKGYALVNGRLSYQADRFSIAVWGKNILDKKYFPFGYDTAGAFGTVLLTPGVPRTYGVEATVKF